MFVMVAKSSPSDMYWARIKRKKDYIK